jgi:hypothetical protein
VKHKTLTSQQRDTMIHALRVAAEQFRADEQTMAQLANASTEVARADQDGVPFFTATGATRLSEQFRMYRKQTLDLLELVDDCLGVALIPEDEA